MRDDKDLFVVSLV